MVGKVIELGNMISPARTAAVAVAAPAKVEAKVLRNFAREFNPKALALAETAGPRMRIVREYLEMSRPKFADVLEVPATTLKNYELNYRITSLEMVTALNIAPSTQPFVMFILAGSTDNEEFKAYVTGRFDEGQRKALMITI